MHMPIGDGHRGRFVRRCPVALTMMRCALTGVLLALAGCGELEPIVEPEIVDLQLTLDTLRTQVRDAQRSLTEARAEVESRRQELADAQVARAQLEGRVREAERRVAEARHVIEVQREELFAARAERERVFRSSSQLHGQLRQLQRKAAKPGAAPVTDPAEAVVPTGASYQWSFKAPSASPAVNAFTVKRTVPAMSVTSPIGEVIVKPGDTLWSLARKHRVSLNWLRAINQLTDDRIDVGQILFLSEERALIGLSVGNIP
jgi:LysM repeat protein